MDELSENKEVRNLLSFGGNYIVKGIIRLGWKKIFDC